METPAATLPRASSSGGEEEVTPPEQQGSTGTPQAGPGAPPRPQAQAGAPRASPESPTNVLAAGEQTPPPPVEGEPSEMARAVRAAMAQSPGDMRLTALQQVGF